LSKSRQKFKIQQTVVGWGEGGEGGNSSSKALGISLADRPKAKTAKYLGVTLDNKLSWKPHIENKIKKAKRFLMAVRSVMGGTWGPSPACARWSWTSVVRSALAYGSIVWSRVASQKGLITKLKRLQPLPTSTVAG
jgi:hypothetical protein